jgi:hypothetical protein
LHEGIERGVQVLLGECRHAAEIDARVERGKAVELEGALCDAGGQIADALEIDDELEGHRDEAEVGGDGLASCEDLEGELVDFVFVLVDVGVSLDDVAREVVVAFLEGLHGAGDLLGGFLAHRREPLAQGAKLLFEVAARECGHQGPPGSRSQKMLPCGRFGSTPTLPCIDSVRCFTIERPRPVPPASREREESAR